MSFDKPTRNALARMVGAIRERLKDDITAQLQSDFRLQPDGTLLSLDGLSEDQRAAAEELRQLLEHFAAPLPQAEEKTKQPNAHGAQSANTGADAVRAQAYDRLVREIGFTILNRLAALRLCEERGLVIECVRQGMTSDGFRLFDQLTGGALGPRYATYRAFLENLFDELAIDLGMLFDRHSPLSHVFPSERALEDVLNRLNDPNLKQLWTEDETIGWIYQYYNDEAERKQMRDASQAPRNSRELAVRNQFFTPRYVVEFLTDNTLGRIWYEIRGGETVLRERCRYLVIRPDDKMTGSSSSFIPHPSSFRPKKDPRDIKMLDPAGGSGHFGLYCFDLFETIYEEAYDDADLGPRLQAEFPDRAEYVRQVPRLIIEHNLHIIDIDPRACQIAALALWLRAQRRWQQLGLKPNGRPSIRKANVVCAEPMPGERDILDEFVAELQPPELGELVRFVFERMQLAGEAGSLLKIEEDLRGQIEELRARAGALFAQGDFWDNAEARVLDALREYAEHAGNGGSSRRQLFADDAAQGFAFVDLCLKRFHVILMNPPFGNPSEAGKHYAIEKYFDCKEDIDAAFIRRSDELLESHGLIGAIVNRTQFFKPTLREWREAVLLNSCAFVVSADLGYGVLDGALVEAATYVLEKSSKQSNPSMFFRVLKTDEKATALLSLIEAAQRQQPLLPESYAVVPSSFLELPESRISYWASDSIRSAFQFFGAFNDKWGTARQGSVTSDNFRFLRLCWEIEHDAIATSAEDTHNSKRWAFFAKGGEYSPYYQDFHLVVKWHKNGYEVRNIIGPSGRLLSRPQNLEYNFRPALTYSERTASGFSPRLCPSGLVFSQVGPVIAVNTSSLLTPLLGIFMSRVVAFFIELMVESADAVTSGSAARHYTQGIIGSIPVPNVNDDDVTYLSEQVVAIWKTKCEQDSLNETSRYFIQPDVLLATNDTPSKATLHRYADRLLRRKEDSALIVLESSWNIEKVTRQIYQLDEPALNEIESELGIHPFTLPAKVSLEEVSFVQSYSSSVDDIIDEEVEESGGSRAVTKKTYFADRKIELLCTVYDVHPATIIKARREFGLIPSADSRSAAENVVSYLIGCCYGRWDMRLALEPTLAPKLPDPFDPLPVCPPGMLVGPDGLPATAGRIVSEAWLRARPNAITLPKDEGRFAGMRDENWDIISDSQYPVRIAWDGILVDDAGLDDKVEHPHADDIVRRVREVLAVLWGDRAEAIEQEACEILGVKSLRDYFRAPSGFFADHLKRYSKSRRQAPIYWPLSTASGRYTVWVYYHRLTQDSLFTIVNRYVTPKIDEVQDRLDKVTGKLPSASGKAAVELRAQVDDLKAFLGELIDFKAEMLRIAALPYKPDLNDGVIINAAPLHKFFRLRKWATDTAAVWKKLEAGEYDWAHLAYTIWPRRVEKVCETDRSIAIAHGLEHLCKVEVKKSKGKRKKKEDVVEGE